MINLKYDGTFSKRFSQQRKNLDARLKSLQKDASPDSIHDVRTSIRRVEAAFQLLPKRFRKRSKACRYISGSKKLFKSMSPVRDIDILISNLADLQSISTVKTVLMTLRSERDRRIREILGRAKSLNELKAPKLRKNKLASFQIMKRKRRVLQGLQWRIAELVPLVLQDYEKVDEVHNLRKYCKRLRYTLELVLSEEERDFAGLMEEWQKALGSVRDLDLTAEYIAKNGLESELKQYLEGLKKKRERSLESFVQSAKARLNSSGDLIPIAKTVSSYRVFYG
ncbi:MAG: CHAD domain-containing protein [Thaumarchaeota archaeon]|nr:CHAD domain-containing protein [Nitrososphaerota archaeon]